MPVLNLQRRRLAPETRASRPGGFGLPGLTSEAQGVSARGWRTRYVVAVAAVALTFLLHGVLAAQVERSPLMLYIVAVVVAGVYGGALPALAAAALSAAAATAIVLHEPVRVSFAESRIQAPLLIFAFSGALIAYVVYGLHEAVRTLRGNEQRFRAIVEGVRDYAIFMLNTRGIVSSWNPGAERITGFSGGEIVGRHFSVFFPVEQVAAGDPARELETAARRGSVEYEGWRLRKDGSRFWANVLVTAVRDESGVLVGFSKITRDLTERKAAEEAAHRRYLQALIDASPDLVSFIDRDFRYVFANRTYERLFGISAAAMRGRRVEDVIGRDWFEAVRPHLERARAGESVSYETQVRDPNGDRRWVQGRYEPAPAEEGVPDGFFVFVSDVSERKAAEEALRRGERELESAVAARTEELGRTVAELEAFSYTVSHDLRAPLRAIQGYAALILERDSERLRPESVAMLERVAAAGARLDRMIRDLLTYNRASRAEPLIESVDAEAALAHALEQFDEPRRAAVTVRRPLGRVQGQESLLAQALSQLLANAFQFAAPGRAPRVEVLREPAADGRVRLVVSDNGVGVPPEYGRKLFEPFTRLRPADGGEGTGIGLAIVKKAAERMGGGVGYDSRPGEGSRFWLELREA